MTVTRATLDDLDWVVDVLAARRRALVPHAPVFWRPAPDATERHREFLGSLLADNSTVALRTETSLVIAVARDGGRLVDDAVLATSSDAPAIWAALRSRCPGEEVRFVCPTYEKRGVFARSVDLAVAESWWLVELPDSGGGVADRRVHLPGAHAITVAAPPVYAPPGPVLFLPSVSASDALPAALDAAPGLGCAAVVVNQPAGDTALGPHLVAAGFVRHCDFWVGRL